MLKITVTETHKFINLDNGKECKVISTRQGDNFLVTFRGWNPFPCYQMVTSWPTFVDWMTNNNWIETNGFLRIVDKVTENE